MLGQLLHRYEYKHLFFNVSFRWFSESLGEGSFILEAWKRLAPGAGTLFQLRGFMDNFTVFVIDFLYTFLAPIFNSRLFYGKLCLITIFWGKLFHWTNIREATNIPRKLSILGRRFFLQVRWTKFLSKNSNMTLSTLIKKLFGNLFF